MTTKIQEVIAKMVMDKGWGLTGRQAASIAGDVLQMPEIVALVSASRNAVADLVCLSGGRDARYMKTINALADAVTPFTSEQGE